MKLKDLFESSSEVKLGDLSIDGEIVAPNGVRREEWKGKLNAIKIDLTSLEGAPKKVGGFFSCSWNERLTSLVGGPEEVGGFYSTKSCDLTSLEGAPKKVGGYFNCSGNKRLTSLAGIHKHIKEIRGEFRCDSDLSGPVLGLLKIKKLRGVRLKDNKLAAILNKYLPEGDLIDCQQELIDAGYEEMAKL